MSVGRVEQEKKYIKIHLFECASAQLTLGAWSNKCIEDHQVHVPHLILTRVYFFFMNMYPFLFSIVHVFAVCFYAVAHDYILLPLNCMHNSAHMLMVCYALLHSILFNINFVFSMSTVVNTVHIYIATSLPI